MSKKIDAATHPSRLLPVIILIVCCLPTPGYGAFSFSDSDGHPQRFERACSSIISLYPAHTDNLIRMGATDKLIGISSSYDDPVPDSLHSVQRYSAHDSAEKFIAANPACVLIRPMISNRSSQLIEKLKKYGIAVISLQPHTIDELFTYWRQLGLLSGRQEEAEHMIDDFRGRLAHYREKTATLPNASRPKVYFESIHARMRTFAPDSIAVFCLTAAGGTNIAADAVSRHGTNIADYGKERILAKAAAIDVYLAQSGRMNRVTRADIIAEPGFGAIKAVRNGRVHLVSEPLVSRPTFKLLDGIAQIHRLLYQNNLTR